ncbi:serine/threonine protein kinase [Hyalangium versicolor]|uniref:serine/threonine protein kinase n=1 Tax=Hyalangium versicolor TaxID=2861190 RepID=UPI001CCCDC8E|nr:serine/threonine-protein kinase [Hyalangium versicolor]
MTDYMPHPIALVPGERVGDWIIRRKLGAGAFGAVYLVDYEGDPFAIKFALRRIQSDDLNQTAARLRKEFASLLRVRHPNVVRTYGCGHWPHPKTGYSYVLMDFVDGLTLHEWRRRCVPTFRQMCQLFSTIALALDALDREHVRHRDVKGSNILVRFSDGEPVLVDFGSANYPHAARITEGPLPPATPHCRSPESIRFHRTHYRDPNAYYDYQLTDDLYSLGVTLYEMLAGRAPFSLDLPRELLNIEIEERVPPSPSTVDERISASLSRLALRLLEKRPQDRHQTGQSLHDEFQSIMRTESALMEEKVLVRPVDLISPEEPDEEA